MKEAFLFLDREVVRKYLTPGEVIRIVKEIWKQRKTGTIVEGNHAFLQAGKENDNVFLHIPACLTGQGVLGFKWINCYMKPAPGYPFSHGNIIVLNDIVTGSLKAVVSAIDITTMRTAGGHGVAAASCLAKKNVRTLAVIGGGAEAISGINGFLCEYPQLEKICLYCRQEKKFEMLRQMFSDQICMEYVLESSQIGKGADVILVATSSPDILLRYQDLEKGTTVIALDGFIDVDPEISQKADKWFVGNRKTDGLEIIDSGEMSHGVQLHYEDITGEIDDVLNELIPGRESEDEIIVYTHMGAGAYDIACAELVYEKAAEAGDGVELRL